MSAADWVAIELCIVYGLLALMYVSARRALKKK